MIWRIRSFVEELLDMNVWLFLITFFSILFFGLGLLYVGIRLENEEREQKLIQNTPTTYITYTATVTEIKPTITSIIQIKITETPFETATIVPTATFTLVPTDTQIIVPTDVPTTVSNCISAYPSVCILPGERIACADLGYHNFTVLPPDPLNYDRDNDGIGCEE